MSCFSQTTMVTWASFTSYDQYVHYHQPKPFSMNFGFISCGCVSSFSCTSQIPYSCFVIGQRNELWQKRNTRCPLSLYFLSWFHYRHMVGCLAIVDLFLKRIETSLHMFWKLLLSDKNLFSGIFKKLQLSIGSILYFLPCSGFKEANNGITQPLIADHTSVQLYNFADSIFDH